MKRKVIQFHLAEDKVAPSTTTGLGHRHSGQHTREGYKIVYSNNSF